MQNISSNNIALTFSHSRKWSFSVRHRVLRARRNREFDQALKKHVWTSYERYFLRTTKLHKKTTKS